MNDLFEMWLMAEMIKDMSQSYPTERNVQAEQRDAAYQVARHCARCMEDRTCSGDCDACPVNVAHYIDKKEAGLLHVQAVLDERQARQDARQVRENANAEFWGNLLAFGYFAGVILFLFRGCIFK